MTAQQHPCPRCGKLRFIQSKEMALATLCMECHLAEYHNQPSWCECEDPQVVRIPLFQTSYCGKCGRGFDV